MVAEIHRSLISPARISSEKDAFALHQVHSVEAPHDVTCCQFNVCTATYFMLG